MTNCVFFCVVLSCFLFAGIVLLTYLCDNFYSFLNSKRYGTFKQTLKSVFTNSSFSGWGNTVYLQNESVNTDYEVFSNQTFAGSNVTTDKPNGPVEVNKGNTIINGTNGVTINDSFEVKNGASFEIRTN